MILAQVNTSDGMPAPGWVGTIIIVAAVLALIFIGAMFLRRRKG